MDSAMAERINQLHESFEEHIQRLGHSMIGVFPVEKGDYTFTYTIGLKESGMPELIFVGLSNDAAADLISHVFATYTKQGKIPQRGDILDDFIQGGLILRLGGVDETLSRDEYLCQAWNRQERVGNPGIEALQIIMSDREGNFPLDPAYDAEYMDPRMPCLAPNGVWDYLPEGETIHAENADSIRDILIKKRSN